MKTAASSKGETVSLTIELPLERLTVLEPRPLLVTNRNAEQMLGVTRRVFLDWLPELERDGVHVVRRGKLRAVLFDDLERWLRARGASRIPPPPSESDSSEDALVRELGLRRVAGRR